jgi:cytidylate kinase
MEGRDIGTKVFPDAELKIFLDAADDIRGQRRYLQQVVPSEIRSADAPTRASVLAAVRERDARDRNRVASPLEPAADAIHLDTTTMTLEEVLSRAEELVLATVQARYE